LGYSSHLISDSFTIDGVKFFYPFGKSYSGKIRTGGLVEKSIFVVFSLVDLTLVIFSCF
jgi:membrane-bound metal-dependent hydrolase YbcI (DUF457 family)